MLTHLADLGASVFVLQEAARHSEFKTTQRYLHMQRACLTSEAAAPRPGLARTLA